MIKHVPLQDFAASNGAGLSDLQFSFTQLAKAHRQLREDLEAEKKKRRSRDKLLVRMWKGMKTLLKALAPKKKVLQLKASDA